MSGARLATKKRPERSMSEDDEVNEGEAQSKQASGKEWQGSGAKASKGWSQGRCRHAAEGEGLAAAPGQRLGQMGVKVKMMSEEKKARTNDEVKKKGLRGVK